MPRAIAPLVTITTSSPCRCMPASASQTGERPSVRGSPSPSATTLEPSFTTTRLMPGAYLAAGRCQPTSCSSTQRASLAGGARIQLEGHAPYLDLIAGAKTLLLQRPEHSDPTQPFLHIRHRIIVLDVIACQQALDALPPDGKR